ncbi:hypothetical protein LCGC14_2423010 [marine sediment metagenome]|uniref:Uncharacterized protein n=1 Tax=marine sediment metagenome TaxID=412755 RepID=A0A0F9E163_9ZZZZ
MNKLTSMFKLGAWSLQKDTVLSSKNRRRVNIASIRHQCKGRQDSGHTIWFNDKGGITVCYCGAIVPDVIQCLCILFNIGWDDPND